MTARILTKSSPACRLEDGAFRDVSTRGGPLPRQVTSRSTRRAICKLSILDPALGVTAKDGSVYYSLGSNLWIQLTSGPHAKDTYSKVVPAGRTASSRR